MLRRLKAKYSMMIFCLLFIFNCQLSHQDFIMDDSFDARAASQPNPCGLHARERCLDPMRKQINIQHLVFGKSDLEVETTCRKVELVVTCLERMAQQCQTSNDRMRTHIERVLTSHRNMQKELCDLSSTFRLKYLRHANCLDRISGKTAKCIREYNNEIVNMMREVTHHKKKYGFVHTDALCCALERHNSCTREIIESQCNSTAAELAEEMFRLTKGDFTGDCQRGENYRQCNYANMIGIDKLFVFFGVVFVVILI